VGDIRPLFAIASELAELRHGRVSRRQLLDAGVDADRIKRWVRDGRLRQVHKGVYAVGHVAPSRLADLMAAVLAGGEDAVASHASAVHLFGIFRYPPPHPEITVPTTSHPARPGIVIHRVASIHVLDTDTWHAIPTTTVPRLLLDLAPRLALADLTRACHEAWIHRRTTPRDVERCIARNPRKHGISNLRRALGSDVTLSVLEDGFLDLLKRHDLPRPRTNIDLQGDKVDCHWPEHDLTIELLSFTFHATRHAFEADVARRRRSNHIAYTYGDVFERGARTAAEVGRRLATNA
jgi:Transcriptional regulator, AbiEi antitoxin